MSNKFRYDIQGLRAIAVICVVIFHINPNILPGGYLGVDIFFVISGYLIIGHIWDSLEKNKFNLMNFYVKRVNRLFPALFIMIIVTILFGYFIFLPTETIDFHNSVISSLFYFSNFYFYSVSDYFNSNIHYSPLLHTWSLSVEEQFYLIFPLLFIFLYKFKDHILSILIITFFLFFLISILLIEYDSSLAFYSSPSRFFQFFAGGILAISKVNNNLSKRTNEILTLIGLLLVSICIFIYDKNTIFPGLNALLPTLATVIIIYSANNSKYSKLLLTNKFSQFLGNASYSIYLWHWPLIVYFKLYINNPTRVEQMLLLVISIFLGYLSWYFIENKTRYLKYRINPIFISLFLSFTLAIIMYFTLDGLKYRFDYQQIKMANYLNYDNSHYRMGKCFLTSKYDDIKFFDKKMCITFDKTKKNILLIGDSHGAMIYSTLSNNLKKDETLTQINASGCRPLTYLAGEKRCTDLMDFVFNDEIIKNRYDTIVLSANWKKEDLPYIANTLDHIQKYTNNIIIWGRNINYGQTLPRLLIFNKEYTNQPMDINNIENYKESYDIEIEFRKLLMKNSNVLYISTIEPFCNNDKCNFLLKDNIPIVNDTNHLTSEAVDYIYKEYLNKQIIKE